MGHIAPQTRQDPPADPILPAILHNPSRTRNNFLSCLSVSQFIDLIWVLLMLLVFDLFVAVIARGTMGAPYVCMQWVRRVHGARRTHLDRLSKLTTGRLARRLPRPATPAQFSLRGALSDKEGVPWWEVPRDGHTLAHQREGVWAAACAHTASRQEARARAGLEHGVVRAAAMLAELWAAGGSGAARGAEQPIL
ncbi:hypothetical protein DFH09DRAFT_1301284 [Mycena vulgaris]|nr:hypothetical protein DFH09DRAFT_1301284 [Mycena vulgaris]